MANLPFADDSSRWAAVSSRDARADRAFCYGVKTTQIYCRPNCKARLARRANVMFYDTAKAAEQDGFRPCKRCRPELDFYDPQRRVVEEACSTIAEEAQSGKQVSLRMLAARAGLTESHFHRVFKGVTGLTPKTYAKSLTGNDGGALTLSTTPTDIATPADFESTVPGPQPTVVDDWCLDSTWNVAPLSPAVGVDFETKDIGPCQVEYTIQPWSSSYVMIAVAEGVICAIQSAESISELVMDVEHRFPTSRFCLSDWERGQKPTEQSHMLFEAVMTALEHPTGKMLTVSSTAMVPVLEPCLK